LQHLPIKKQGTTNYENKMSNTNFEYSRAFNNPKVTVIMQLSLVAYVDDDDIHYVYCPALDLTGYGHTDEEATSSFEKTIELYLEYTVNKQTFVADLKAHGWNLKNKKIVSPSFRDMIKRNKDFENIIENRNFTKFTRNIKIPDCVYA